jgi:hypothetical protein
MMLGVVDLLRSGALELDCALMELVQDDAEAPRLYRGPGYIRQDDKGWITFKMFPTETRNLPSGLEEPRGQTEFQVNLKLGLTPPSSRFRSR